MGNAALCQNTKATGTDLDERQEMLRVWTKIVTKIGSASVGAEIFKRILVQSSSVPRLFNLQDTPPSEYPNRAEFVVHASRIFDTLNRFFDTWAQGNDRKLRKDASALGKQHFTNLALKNNNYKGFNPSLWLLMPSIMAEVFGPHLEKEQPHLKKQMHMFIEVVVNAMRNSYTEQAVARGYTV